MFFGLAVSLDALQCAPRELPFLLERVGRRQVERVLPNRVFGFCSPPELDGLLKIFVLGRVDGFAVEGGRLTVQDESAFEASSEGTHFESRFPTMGAVVAFMLIGHVPFHLGQISAWRRVAGMGIISNKDGNLLRKECKSLGWNKYFKIIIGANDAKEDKPSKYPFLLALKKISKKPSKKIWYVGDSDIDIIFAKRMECFSIFLENDILNKKKMKEKPNLIIKNLDSLKRFI